MKITIDIPPGLEARLGEVAARLNVSADDLASAALRDLLMRPGEGFERAVTRLLERNRQLYRRLA